MPSDPTRQSRWRPLRVLLAAMDDDIARLYAERGVESVRPRYALPLIRLAHRGPMSIGELADALDVTHSAMSQTVAALRRLRLVRDVRNTDARRRSVTLSRRGRALVPFLESEWEATERALAELESELPYPLTRVVADIEAALERRSFHDRIVDHLREPASEP